MAISVNGEYVSGSSSDNVIIKLHTNDGEGQDFTPPKVETDNSYAERLNKQYDLIKDLQDMGYTARYDSNGVLQISSDTDNLLQDIEVEKETIPDIVTTNESESLRDIVKTNSTNQLKAKESEIVALKNQNALLHENNSLLLSQTKVLNDLVKVVSSSNNAMVSEVNKLVSLKNTDNDLKMASLILQADYNKTMKDKSFSNTVNFDTASIDSIVSTMSDTLSEIKDKDFTSTVNNTINMDTTKIEESTESIKTATETLASGVTDQIATNEKLVEKANVQIEEINFNKTGSDTLIDSSDNKIIPREVKAHNNAEYAIYKKMDNLMPYGDLVPTEEEVAAEQNEENIMAAVIKDSLKFDITKIKNADNYKTEEA